VKTRKEVDVIGGTDRRKEVDVIGGTDRRKEVVATSSVGRTGG
jgi:hypothetical protein